MVVLRFVQTLKVVTPVLVILAMNWRMITMAVMVNTIIIVIVSVLALVFISIIFRY